jgi:hypothetical protein
MKNTPIHCFLLGFVLSLVTVSCQGQLATNSPGRKSSLSDLTALVHTIDPLPPDSSAYSRSNWNALIEAARIVQKCEPQSVITALKQYQESTATNMHTLDDTRLLLLMRVIFEIPDRAEPNEGHKFFGKAFGGWITLGTHIYADGSLNLAWPITWNDGNPALRSGYIGLQGARYDAAEEYRELREKYSLRKLSLLSK